MPLWWKINTTTDLEVGLVVIKSNIVYYKGCDFLCGQCVLLQFKKKLGCQGLREVYHSCKVRTQSSDDNLVNAVAIHQTFTHVL